MPGVRIDDDDYDYDYDDRYDDDAGVFVVMRVRRGGACVRVACVTVGASGRGGVRVMDGTRARGGHARGARGRIFLARARGAGRGEGRGEARRGGCVCVCVCGDWRVVSSVGVIVARFARRF